MDGKPKDILMSQNKAAKLLFELYTATWVGTLWTMNIYVRVITEIVN